MRKQAQWAVLLFAAALLLPAWSVQGQDQTAAAKKLLAANGSLRAKRYETAATQYEEFLSRFKDHRDRAAARYGLGISLYQLKKYPEAERQLIEAIRSKDFQQAPEARALLGQSRMARNDMNGALEAFGELAGKHPDNPLAELAGLNIVRLLYQMDKTDEATKKADDFLKKHKDSGYRTGVLYYKGLSQRKSGNPAAAAESFQAVAAVENSPYLLNALLLAGQSYEAAGQTDKALAAYRKLIDRADEGRKADGRYSLAVALQRAGKHSDAVEAFEQLLKTHEGPYAPAGRFQMGISQLKAGKADDAARTFQQVIKSDKDRSRRGRYWLARARMAKDDHDAAAKLLDEVLDSKGNLPEEAAARYDLATCRMKLGQHAQAAEDFKTVTERHAQSPYAPDAAYRRAWCLQQAGKTKEAIELAEKIARQDDHPMAGPAAELAAECHFTLGQYDQAAKTFSRLAASAEGDNARRFALRRGQSAFLVGDSKKAIDVLKPVAEQKSAGDDRIGRQAMLYLGQALLKTDQPAQAADILHRFVRSEAKAGRLEGRYYLARALRRADKQDEAAKVLEPFEKVKAQESAIVPYAWFELAEIHYQKDQPEPAEKLLERIIQAKAPKPVTASAQLLRGWIAYDAKEYKTAAERFGRFAEDYPDSANRGEARFRQAEALRLAGEPDKALPIFRELAKDNDQAARLVGTCLAEMGQHDKAADVLAELASNDKRATQQTMYELAWAQKDSGQREQSVESYRKLLEKFPEGPLATPARAELAELLYAREKFDEALGLLTKVLADESAPPAVRKVALYRQGWCYQKLDQPAKARDAFAAYAKAHADSEQTPSALYQGSLAAQEVRDFQTAESMLETLLQSGKADDLEPFALLKLGEVREMQNHYGDALKAWQEYLKKFDKHEFKHIALYGTGWALQNQRKYSDARNWYAKIADSDHQGETAAKAQFQLGECFFEEGKLKEALDAFYVVGDVYGYDKWTANALYEAGRVLEKLGRKSEAIGQYTRVVEDYKDQTIAAAARKRLAELKQ